MHSITKETELKRFFRIFIALLLLTSTVGISVSRHYCGEILSEIYLALSADSCCGESDKEPMGCCHTESEIFEIKDQFKFQQSFEYKLQSDLPLLADISDWFQLISETEIKPNHPNSFKDYSPPKNKPITILHQVFLI